MSSAVRFEKSDWQKVRLWVAQTRKKASAEPCDSTSAPQQVKWCSVDKNSLEKTMAVDRFKEVFHSSPWLKPFLIRLGLSVVLLLYVVSGAGIFMGVMEPSTQDLYVQEKLERLRNDTALLMANEMAGQEAEKAAQAMARYLVTYERELERSRSRSPVDELLLTARDEQGRRSLENPGASYENSLYFTLSLLTATTSGNLLRLPDGVQVLVIIYTLIGGPLALSWLVLMGRSMAQLWLLVCVHSCCCGMSSLRKVDSSLLRRLFLRAWRRNRTITPETPPDDIVPHSPPRTKRISSANSCTPSTRSAGEVSMIGDLETSERNVLVQPENLDEYLRLVRGDLILPLWSLALFFLLFGLFGATVAAVSHKVSFMTAFFYGYLIFTTIGGIMPNLSLSTAPQTQYLSRFSGEDVFAFIVVQQYRAVKVLWMIYFLLGYIMLAGIVYLAYLVVTWRCGFCRTMGNSSEKEEPAVERISSNIANSNETQVTPVEIIPPRRTATPGAVLMGSKVIESRRTSAALTVGRQTSIDVETPDIEEELLMLEDVPAEPDGELEARSESDSGISKTGSSERAASAAEADDGDRDMNTEETKEDEETAEDDEANMEDRITVKSRGSVRSIVVSPSSEEVRPREGTPASLVDNNNRRGSAMSISSVIHVREASRTPDSIGSVGRDGLLGSAMSEEDIRNEPEPDLMRDIIEQISDEVALQELQEDLTVTISATDDQPAEGSGDELEDSSTVEEEIKPAMESV